MYTSHNVGRMIECVVTSLQRDVLPAASDPQAVMAAEMCIAVLAWARGLAAKEQQLYSQEAHEMLQLYAALERLLSDDTSEQGQRVRDRARELRESLSVAVPQAYDTLLEAHRALSGGLIPTLEDLHANASLSEGLAMVRSHLAQRTKRDVEVYLGAVTGEAMVGRS